MLLIIPILTFVILCICLPQLMINTLVGSFGYFVCRAVGKRRMSKMIIIITIFTCLSVIMEKVLPLVKEVDNKKEYINNTEKYINPPNSKLYNKNDIQKPIDKILEEKLPDNFITRILQEYPRTR